MAKAAATTEANRLAFERLTQSDPVLVDVRPVGEFVPGFAPQYDSHLRAADGVGGL